MTVPAHDGNRPAVILASYGAASNSWSQKVDSWLKQTHHDEMVGRQAGLFSQPSVLSTHYLFLIDTLHPFTYYPFIKFFPI